MEISKFGVYKDKLFKYERTRAKKVIQKNFSTILNSLLKVFRNFFLHFTILPSSLALMLLNSRLPAVLGESVFVVAAVVADGNDDDDDEDKVLCFQ